MTAIFGFIIGVLVFAAGVYYLNQNKTDAESRKIYGIASAVGAGIAIVCAVMLLL